MNKEILKLLEFIKIFNHQGVLERKPMRNISEFLEDTQEEKYIVTQPSVLKCIGKKGIKRADIIRDYAYTITCKVMRTPAQVIDLGNGKYRYLTERECWRLQGYDDEDFEAALKVHPGIKGKLNGVLYKQAGNSIPIPILEAIFKELI